MSAPSSGAGDTTPFAQPQPQATKPAAAPAQPTKAEAPAPKAKSRVVKPRENPAEALMLAKEREKAAAATTALDKLNADNLFFLRCVNRPDHHGIYLMEYPHDGNIHPGLWASIEHAPGEPWHKPAIRCQECLVDGDSRAAMWLKPHPMPNGQYTFSLAQPYGVALDKPQGKDGAGHINRISKAELEERMGKEAVEAIFNPPVAAGAEKEGN